MYSKSKLKEYLKLIKSARNIEAHRKFEIVSIARLVEIILQIKLTIKLIK